MIKGKQIFDCFTFFNEKELLELRFMEYYDVVDYFVIVEATKTHTGKPHKPIFESLKPNLEKYLNKVIHVVVDDLPEYSDDNIWIAENFQRNAIERGLKGIAKKGDAIFVSDLDEFWNIDKLKECIGVKHPIAFEQELYYYWVNCKQNCLWTGTCYAPYGLMTPQEMRNYTRFNKNIKYVIKNGGWHYSYMGSAEKIKEKVENICESKEIIEKVGSIEKIQNSLENVKDLWDREEDYAKKRFVKLGNYKPKKLDLFLQKYPEFQKKIKNIEIITLIYCSVKYLDMIIDELKRTVYENKDYAIGIRIVANNANRKVLKKLKSSGINYTIYNDKKPKDYYINRVYRCYNFAVETSEYDNVCLVNSDMLFSPHWLDNLLKHHDGTNIPTSRLVESGKMPSGKYGIGIDCGKNPQTINYDKWNEISKKMMKEDENIVKQGGLFMPVVFEKKRFLEAGGYPEGNVYADGTIGTRNGNVIFSGDNYFFTEVLEKKFGMKHVTVFDSLVYHIQEGEKDENEKRINFKNLIFKKEKIGSKRILRILGIKISYKKNKRLKWGKVKLQTPEITMPDFVNTIKKYIKNTKDCTFMEIGSRDGKDSQFMKQIFKERNIYAIEANPEEYQLHKEENNNINWINAAVFDEEKLVQFHVKGIGSGLHSIKDRGEKFGNKSIDVKTQRVDSIIEAQKIKCVDVVKIDTEGCSLETLKSFGKYLKEIKILHIETETEEYFKDQFLEEDVFKFLKENGFKIIEYSCCEGLNQHDSIWINRRRK